MKYYLGIDGGGTKTTAVICDETGRFISSFTGKSINYNSIGMSEARKNLKNVTDGLFKNHEGIHVDAAFIGMSAISERADSELTGAFCAGILNCENITMDNDVFIGLEAMLCSDPVAMVISGTGSMAVGRLSDGTVLQAGGWGYILGDEGSGYAVALDGLKAAICGFEGNGESTMLTQTVLDYYSINNLRQLIDIFYDPPKPRSEIAKFAVELFKCARAGDKVSKDIMNCHAARLADTVSALLEQMPVGTPLGLWGGVMQGCPEYREIFTMIINKKFPESQISLLRYPPELGAVFAAMKTDGIIVNQEIAEKALLYTKITGGYHE